MALVRSRDGQWFRWEPTTDLRCSYCREPFVASPNTRRDVQFTFEFGRRGLARGEYWYFHGPCADIEHALQVDWGWWPMAWVLGLPNGYCGGNIQKYLHKTMPAGTYTALYEAWKPSWQSIKAQRPERDSNRGMYSSRFRILKRDGYRCQLCGRTAKDHDVVLEVDHIIARARGGTDDDGNRWTLCFACNRGKHTHSL